MPWWVLVALLCPSAASGDPQYPLSAFSPAASEELLSPSQPVQPEWEGFGHCGDRRGSGKAQRSAHSPELSSAAFQNWSRDRHILPQATNDSFIIAVLSRLLFVAALILISQ